MPEEALDEKLDSLPEGPGVYLFRDARKRILYIGKAKSLRNRVRSYFQSGRNADPKTAFLSRNIDDLEYIVTDNEVEALILESSLVKKHQPRLNVRLKDDKSFLHIKLTVNEPFPRVLLTRRIAQDGALYFGPYLPASLARNTVKIINRHFLLRTCDIAIDGKLERPCLEYYIKRCLAPCVQGLCSKEEYEGAVQDVILLLEGKNRQLIQTLTEKMRQAARRQNFEAAAFYRDRIRMVQDLAEKQKMVLSGGDDVDVFAYYREDCRLALQLFTLREGKVVGKREFYWEDLEFFEPAQFLSNALQQYYFNAGVIPHQIYLPLEVENQELLSTWLSGKKRNSRRRVRISVPRRGDKHDLLLLVERNARIAFESRFRIARRGSREVLSRLGKALALPRLPERIEAFDVSNIQGSDSVASMVVCRDGNMEKSEYRRFQIKSVEGADDFASIYEVVRRRYLRLLKESGQIPDLILIDGGKGQLHSAYQALSQLGLEEVPLAGLAKREEWIYLQGQEEPLIFNRNAPELHFLQRIRDEAHRFAVSYHRRRRSLRDFASELDSIAGIGSKRKKRLLQNFGSVRRIREASEEELAPFVGKELARLIKESLNRDPSRPAPSGSGPL